MKYKVLTFWLSSYSYKILQSKTRRKEREKLNLHTRCLIRKGEKQDNTQTSEEMKCKREEHSNHQRMSYIFCPTMMYPMVSDYPT